AAEAKTQRRARLHLETERGVVETKLLDALAQLFKIIGIGREEAAEDDRLDLLEPRQRGCGGPLRVGDRIADTRLRNILDLRGDEADLARADLGEVLPFGSEAADAVDEVGRAR